MSQTIFSLPTAYTRIFQTKDDEVYSQNFSVTKPKNSGRVLLAYHVNTTFHMEDKTNHLQDFKYQ